ncbi:MAG: PilZ domain-containing protein [Elusimicrobia bacterium]|nr:PilZ domain-containing protein [Elusimicrobiota bacterium]
MINKIDAEQRRHPRVPLGVTLDINMKGGAMAKCRATIMDLSAAGMTFKTDADFEEGMTLHLRFNPALQIRGEVRSVRGSTGGQRRYGVRFHKIDYSPAN